MAGVGEEDLGRTWAGWSTHSKGTGGGGDVGFAMH